MLALTWTVTQLRILVKHGCDGLSAGALGALPRKAGGHDTATTTGRTKLDPTFSRVKRK